MHLRWFMENSYPQFTYNEGAKTFEVNDGESRVTAHCAMKAYKEISAQLDRIKKQVDDFLAESPYYSTSAINKYIGGLGGFDVASFARRYATDNLICREYVEDKFSKLPGNLDKMMLSEDSNETKARKLTDYLNTQSQIIQGAIEENIRMAIEMEEYIKHFSKAFKLKSRRKEMPLQDMLDKMKS